MNATAPMTARARSLVNEPVALHDPVNIVVCGPPTEDVLQAESLVLTTLPASAARPRILLIDDDEQVLASLALVLEGEGYDAFLASDGYEAVARCRSHGPDLVVVDLNIPHKDGWATLEAIEDIRPFLPMVVITGKPMQFERAVAFGVDALMEKPLDIPTLLAAIQKLLAEPAYARLARVTDLNFRTVRLNSAGGRVS